MAEAKAKTPGKGAPAGGGAKGAGAKGKGAAKTAGGAVDPAPKVSDGTPRLLQYYLTTVRPRLAKQLGLENPHEIPRVLKVVLNVGVGDASKNPKGLEAVVEELTAISGQRPVVTRAKKSISNFGLRAGVPVGVMVTLRGARMYEFLDRFISLAVPRIRDFRGLPNRSFDGRGNYSFGLREQLVFPEIDYDKVEKIHGMDITIVTSARRDDRALALMREFGWPFRGETPQRIMAA
jgi:large subunit ribosomal protein L5